MVEVCNRDGCNREISKTKVYCNECLMEKFTIIKELENKYEGKQRINLELYKLGFTKK